MLLAVLLAAFVCDKADAQNRWPPWQSYGEAEKAARAKAKRRAPVPKQSQIDALNAKAAKLRQAGKIDEAIVAAKRALGLTQRRHGRNHVATAAALTTLAELYIEKKRYADAEPLLKRAVAIREKAAPDSPELGDALYALGSLYKKQGRLAEAEPLLRRSAAMSDKVGTGREKTVAAAPHSEAPRKPEGGSGIKSAREKADAAAKNKEAAERARQAAEAMTAAKQEAAPPAAKAPAPSTGMKKKFAKKFAKPRARAYRRAVRPPGTAAPSAPKSAEPGLDGAAPSNSAEHDSHWCKMFPKYCGDEATPGGSQAGPPAAQAPSEVSPEVDAAARSRGPGTPAPMAAPAGGAKSAEESHAPVAMSREPAAAEEAAPAAGPPPSDVGEPEVGMLAKQDKWDVLPVFFGTDRAEEANPKRLSYSSDRAHRLELGRALVTVPKAHEVPQIERPWAIRIPYFNVTIYEEAEDPNKHFTMQELKKLSKEDLLKLVRERLAKSSRFKDQALVFVHGYNTSFDNAVYRTAQIAYDLKFDGAPFLYSWPSGGAVASYTYDRESAEASKPYMRRFLEMVVKETGAKAVSIIAHSMGNQPLLGVLKDMKQSAPEGVVISQVILAAPDVDADSFSNLATTIEGMAKGVTLYAASNDRALIVSRNFWGHTRAGDVPEEGPLVLPGIDTIDVTAASTDVFALNHSEYAQNTKVLDDIGELIETGKRPPEERLMAPARVATDHGDYWRYTAPPPP